MKKDYSFCSCASDVLASLLSLLLFLWNVTANVWTVVSFYQEQNYVSMGVFLFLILSSSMLVQTFSWLWYSDASENLDTTVERFMYRHGLLALVHLLHLGIFLRYLGMMELSVINFEQKAQIQNKLSHDLITLTLFTAFSESAPQLILMLINIIQMQDLQPFTVIKILCSLSSLSSTVLSYHRKMGTFLPEDNKMGWSYSVIYFLWNLFLIGPRVVCVSLFASVLPCYIAAHFLTLWTLLVFWAWWQKTEFMDSKGGEWLYRATIALIWYFTWFNVARRSKKSRSIIYHVVMGVDTMILLGLWWWRRSVESARLSPLPINIYLLIAMLVTIYMVGVVLKLLYYWKLQPVLEMKQAQCADTVDSPLTDSAPTQRIKASIQKRMRNMAVNFYC